MEKYSENKQILEKEIDKWKKIKFAKEWDVLKFENQDRVRHDEMEKLNNATSLLHKETQDLLKMTTKMICQAKKAEIIGIIENGKIEAKLQNIAEHKQDYSLMFQNANEAAHKAEQSPSCKNFDDEINAVEADIHEIESVNTTLEKRNKAVLLRVRKSLQDTESARRRLLHQIQMKQN